MNEQNSDTSLSDIWAAAPIYSYSRAQAIEDGVLIDVSETAKEAGFKFPVAITSAAWADCVEWSEEDGRRKGIHQDEAGRLWDVLWMLSLAAKRTPGSLVSYQLARVERTGKSRKAYMTTLKAVIGPGDTIEPVITVMMADES